MKKQIDCTDCKMPFEYEVPTKYPDTRKYCDPCGAKRRTDFTGAKTETADMKSKTSTNGEATDFEIGFRKVRLYSLQRANETASMQGNGWNRENIKDLAKFYEKYIVTGE